jgi:arginase
MMKNKISVLDAPSNLGLRPPQPDHMPGVWRLPAALRAQGLVQRLNAQEAGEVQPPAYSTEPDRQTGFRNGTKIAAYSQTLASRVVPLVQTDCFPLVLGGDCSILLGNMLALRSLGEYGLCFIDGHADFAYSRSSKYFGLYAAAGLDLGLVTGHGPDDLTNLNGLKPYVKNSNVVALGFYDDPADATDYRTEAIYQTSIQAIDIDEIRRLGAQQAALATLERLAIPNLQGFWIHLDADVLDQSIMPAVDSPNPKGLTYAELVTILRVLLASEYATGMEITIFDPELDPAGDYAAEFVSAITQAFK